MDLKKVRSMNDEELTNFLKSLSSKNTNCCKCGKMCTKYTLNIQNRKKIKQTKLCNLCDECYTNLLDYLEISDVIW